MIKLSIGTIIVYFFIKYSILSCLNVLLKVGISFFHNDIIDALVYLLVFFVIPIGIPMTIILTYPMYLMNKVRKVLPALLLLLGVFMMEVFIYYVLTSEQDYKRLLINFLVGAVLWSILFLCHFLKERRV